MVHLSPINLESLGYFNKPLGAGTCPWIFLVQLIVGQFWWICLNCKMFCEICSGLVSPPPSPGTCRPSPKIEAWDCRNGRNQVFPVFDPIFAVGNVCLLTEKDKHKVDQSCDRSALSVIFFTISRSSKMSTFFFSIWTYGYASILQAQERDKEKLFFQSVPD